MTQQLTRLIVSICALLLVGSAVAQPAPAKKTSTPAPAPKIEIVTNMGTIVVELYADKTPITVQNFLDYVKSDHYNGLVFHRVIDGFMIQGGGVTPDLTPRQVRAPIELEAGRGLSNLRGTLAMARTSNPNSATSQFFINLVDNKQLDKMGGGYAVFGKVIKGMEVVDKIARLSTKAQQGHQNAPVKPVIIQRMRLLK